MAEGGSESNEPYVSERSDFSELQVKGCILSRALLTAAWEGAIQSFLCA